MYGDNFVRSIQDAYHEKNKAKSNNARRPSTREIEIKEKSGRPRSNTVPTYTGGDPVHNIAMQNPIAQPGGGWFTILPKNTVKSQVHGVMDKKPQNRPIVINITKPFPMGGFGGSGLNDKYAQDINDKYFNAGTRGDGRVFNMPPVGGKQDFETMRLQKMCGKGKSGRKKFDERNIALQGASVVYSRTSLTPTVDTLGTGATIRAPTTFQHLPTWSTTSPVQVQTVNVNARFKTVPVF